MQIEVIEIIPKNLTFLKVSIEFVQVGFSLCVQQFTKNFNFSVDLVSTDVVPTTK